MRTVGVLLFAASIFVASPRWAMAQDSMAIAHELSTQSERVKNSDTQTRVVALHRVWELGVLAGDSDNKIRALELLKEPVNSGSDHIRMPAVYAIVEIANSSLDAKVKVAALTALHGPLTATQVPIRNVAVDAINNIVANGKGAAIALPVLDALGEPVKSSNNGVRMPAINAVVNAVVKANNAAASDKAISLLQAPLESESPIGGMELRMYTIHAIEKIAIDSVDISVKTRAIVLLGTESNKNSFESKTKERVLAAVANIQKSAKDLGNDNRSGKTAPLTPFQ